jgi:hypothetical protein
MGHTRHLVAAMVLGVVGVLALAVLVTGQTTSAVSSAQQQYEQTTSKKLDTNSIDSLYDFAKWCFRNNLRKDAEDNALAALAKAPDDVRVKYLLYVIAAAASGAEEATATTTTTTDQGTNVIPPPPAITDDEAEKVFKAEGRTAMLGFREVQGAMKNRCGAPKCHGGENSASKWMLITKDMASSKTLAQNFLTIKKYIQRGDQAAQSQLLLMPLKGKEGGHTGYQFPTREQDAIYQMIFKWIQTLPTATDIIWGNASKAPPPKIEK